MATFIFQQMAHGTCFVYPIEHILIMQTFFKTNASLGFSRLNGQCIKFLIMLYFQVGQMREGEAVAGCSVPLPSCL